MQAIPPAPMRPAKAMRPAHGTYSVTFSSSDAFLEAWSRFPFSARIGEQALRRASVPSSAVLLRGGGCGPRRLFHSIILVVKCVSICLVKLSTASLQR